jgi:hypothetical protein
MPVTRFTWGGNAGLLPGAVLYQTTPGSPYHAMLLVPPEGTASAATVPAFRVMHMRPPLMAGKLPSPSGPDLWGAHFSGVKAAELEKVIQEAERLVDLSPEDASNFTARSQYDLSVHGVFESDPLDSGGAVNLRASCASFVEHCYAQVEVDLVDEYSLPRVELEDLKGRLELTPAVERQLRPFLQKLTWPCQVLLPAYQLCAFRQDDHSKGFRAAFTDHPFPSNVG